MTNTAKNTAAFKVATSTLVALHKLNKQRVTWEEGIYKQANTELYKMLGGCLTQLAKLRKEGTKAIAAFNGLLEEHNVTFTERTSLELKVVRIVFGINQTKRASNYATVLRIAKKEGVTSKNIVSWITKQGGVEEVRRSGSTAQKTDYKEVAENHFSAVGKSMAMTAFKGVEDSDNDFTLALVRKTTDGKFVIVSEVANPTLVKSALQTLGKTVSKEQAEHTATTANEGKKASAVANSTIPANTNKPQAVAA